MPNTQTLDRIINKIIENKPSRLDGKRRVQHSTTKVRTSPRTTESSRTNATPTRRNVSPRSKPSLNLGSVAKPRETKTLAAPQSLLASQTDASAPTIRRFEPRKNDVSRRFQGTSTIVSATKSTPVSRIVGGGSGMRTGGELGEARAKTPRRRQIDPTTCERDYSADEVEFMKALDEYKRSSGRMFPTCSEILEVFKSLGYVKIATATQETEVSREPQSPRSTTPAFLGDADDDANAERFELNGTCPAFSLA